MPVLWERARGRGKGHDVGLVDAVLTRREGRERRRRREEEVGAEAVVRVDGAAGFKGQLLLGSATVWAWLMRADIHCKAVLAMVFGLLDTAAGGGEKV